jgi:oligosaccharide repeat unit polymerase
MVSFYAIAPLALVQTIRTYRDALCPIILFALIGFIRFSIPALLMAAGAEADISLFRQMRLEENDWQKGHLLWVTTFCGLALGWTLGPWQARSDGKANLQVGLGAAAAAMLGLCIGLGALVLFVASNTSIVDAALTGGFRGTTVQEGTGKFFYLALLVIPSCLVLCNYLLGAGVPRWLALWPAFLVMAAYLVLGGRARAVTGLLGSLLILYYLRRIQGSSNRPRGLSVNVRGLLLMAFFLWLFYAGRLYRGGAGVEAFSQSLSITAVWTDLQKAIFVDIGQLHSLAGSAKVGPGLLHGSTFVRALSWPISEFLEVKGKSTGIFIVQVLAGLGERRWGVHATLIGDAYVNLGVVGLAVVMPLLGLALKWLYVSFRNGSISGVMYALAVCYSTRIFFESIDKWGEFVAVICFASALLILGRSILNLRRPTPDLAFVSHAGNGTGF